MSQRSLPVLVLLLLVLGGAAWWLSQDSEPKEDGNAKLALLAGLDGPPATLHLINRDGSKEYRLREGALGWRLEHPVEDEANQAWVEMLLGQLGAAEKVDAFPDRAPTPKDLTEAGLDEPKGSLIVGSAGDRLRIDFGEECFPPGWAFARVDGELCKITLGIEQAVEVNRDDLRNPLLFRSSGVGVQEVEIQRVEAGVATGVFLRRQPNGGFVVATSKKDDKRYPADPLEVTKLLRNLLGARARRFLPRAAPDTAGKVWLRVRVIGNLGVEIVELTDPNEGVVYATKSDRANLEMEVDSASFERLIDQPVTELLNRRLLPFRPSEASAIEVRVQATPPPPALVLGRRDDGPGFKLTAPSARYADASAVNDLIVALESTRLVEVLEGPAREPARKALETPRVTVTLQSPRSRQLPAVTIRLAKGAGDTLYGKREDDATLWRVESPGFDAFEKPWWRYAEKVAFRTSPMRPVTGVEVEHGGRTRLFTTNTKGKWTVDGRELTVDDYDFEHVFDVLKEVGAEEVLGPAGDGLLDGRRKIAMFRAWSGDAGNPATRQPAGAFEVHEGEGLNRLWGRGAEDVLVFRIDSRPTRVLREFFEWVAKG